MTLGLERIFDLAAFACFFAVNLLWFDPPVGRETEFEYVETVGYVAACGCDLGFVALVDLPAHLAMRDRVGSTYHRPEFHPEDVSDEYFSAFLRKLSGALADT